MDPSELSRWTRFAAKGGIGRCTALQDCIAEGSQDLMFEKDDEITVLMQIPDLDGVYLGYCEGVVGRFQGSDVRFHSKLKKAVMTKRSSVLQAKSPTPSLISPPTPSLPPSPSVPPGRAQYASSLTKPPSPINVLSSSPPPIQVYQPPSRRTSARASSTGIPEKNHTINEELLTKEPSSKLPPGPNPTSHSKPIPTGADTSTDGLRPVASPSNNGLRPTPSPSAPSSSPASSHGHSPLSPSFRFPAGSVPVAPLHEKPKKEPVLERMSSVTSRMSTTEVPDEWVRREVGTLLAEKVEKKTGGEDLRLRQSRTSSNLGYGDFSDDEEANFGNSGTRFSTVSYASDDGEVGIGLSLMGALAESDSDSDGDVDVLGRKTGTVRAGISFESDEDEDTIEGDAQVGSASTQTDRVQHQSEIVSVSDTQGGGPLTSHTKGDQVVPIPVPPRSDSLRFRRDPSLSITNPNSSISLSSTAHPPAEPSSLSPTHSPSDHNRSPHPSDGDLSPHPSDLDEWEGASDIYDNYRYSRYSRYSRFSVATSHRLSGVSINSTRHRQVPSASTMPALMPVLPAAAAGSPTSLAFSPGVATPTSPHPAFGGRPEYKEGAERDDSPVDPSVPSSSNSATFSNINIPVIEPGTFRPLASGILVSTTATTVVEPDAEGSIRNGKQTTSHIRSDSVASTVDSHYSRDSETQGSPLHPPSFVSTASGSPSSDEPVFSKPSHLSMLEANAATFLRPENASLWQTTEKLKIVKTPSPLQEAFPPTSDGTMAESHDSQVASMDQSIVVVAPDNSANTAEAALATTQSSNSPPRAKGLKSRPTPLSLLSTTSTELTGASPLLHTRWGSPVSSTGMSSASASVYDESGSAFSKTLRDSDLSSPAGTVRMASAIRERLETEKTEEIYPSAIGFNNRHSGMPLVVEDDEELPSHAKNHDSKDFEVEGNTTLDTEAGEKDISSVSDSTYTRRVLDGFKGESLGASTSQKTGLNALGKLVTSTDTHTQDESRTPSPTPLIVPASPPSSASVSPVSATVSSHSAGPPSPSPSAFPIPPTHQGDLAPVGPALLPNPAHLRPQLAGDGERRSLFLPHPNAPKPPSDGPGVGPMGPLYQGGNSPQQPGFNPPTNRIDPKKIAIHALRLALSAPPPPPNLLPPPSSAPIRGKGGKPMPTLPPPPPRGPTIYARLDFDLASANGPVPISFGIEPMGPPPLPAPPSLPDNYNKTTTGSPHIVAPSPRAVPSPLRLGSPAQPETLRQTSVMKDIGLSVPRSPLAPPSPLKDVPFFDHNGPQPGRSSSSSPQVPPGPKGGVSLGRSVTASAAIPNINPPSALAGSGGLFVPPDRSIPVRSSSDGESGPPPNLHGTSANIAIHAPIPRANFTPRVGALGMRPRSRSFSAFNSPPVFNKGNSFRDDSGFGRGRELSTSGSPLKAVAASEVSAPRTLTKSISTPKFQVPSPLSLQNANKVGPSSLGLSSPLASSPSAISPPPGSPTVPRTPVSPTKPNGTRLRKVTSVTSFESAASSYSTAAETSPPPSPITQRMSRKQSFISMDGAAVAAVGTNSRPPDMPPVMAGVATPVGGSSDPETSSVLSARSQAVSPPPFGHRASLRSKLSLPNMRRSSGRQDSINSSIRPVPSLESSRTLPIENQTVQVEDMDFELIKPNVPFQNTNGRASEDSSIGRSGSMDRVDQLRAESPAFSIASSGSRLTAGLPSDSAAMRARATSKASDTEASMVSHRQRELKWVSVMSSVPPSQSRKTKKVRKLIGEGVPASVRYLVWSHLTDCKAKNVPGVYASFGKRARVAAFKDIEGDVRRCFAEHAHLQTTQGPVMALLQAYLTMVPDVPYTAGLTLIAGHLLLLAPEEDAFWIFVTIMDSNLRPYFASSSTQMEVDAALFSRALEANDPPLAKKLLMDMSMNPTHICGPWFTALFVGCLPTDYTDRVWDFFLYEGVPFLIRVGLAVVYCCRRALLEATSEEAVLNLLRHPSPKWLPPSADAFVTLALSFKLKDDDVRKQRIKMEAQVKKQAQQAPRSTGVSISFPRN